MSDEDPRAEAVATDVPAGGLPREELAIEKRRRQ
jgi:hypothetical protein